ncbi:MAG: XkdW family protein [Gammaproteobacteria bacterium]
MVFDNTIIGVLIVLIVGLFLWVFVIWANSRQSHQQTHQVLRQQNMVRNDPAAHRLSQALHLLRPTAHVGFDYTIAHDRPGQPPYIASWKARTQMPTQEELDEVMSEVAEVNMKGYAAMRRAEYPSVGDQLDAAYKARQGNDGEQKELDERITEIKNKYPKSDDEL